jgi:1-acyl-sn-glycerol-3-phosphate acyltransferase
MSRLRAAVVFGSTMALSLIVIPPQWLFTKIWPAAARRFPHVYFRAIVRLMGIRIETKGEPVSGRACLYVANHLSWLDILVLSAVRPMCFVAKKEVASWPLFGMLATVGRTIYLDRERRLEVRDTRAVLQRRFTDGEIITLFPEGTSSDGNRVLPFRSALLGAAEMEVDGEPVLVQPVTIAYTGVHGIPLGRVRRPIFAWYGNMELLPHLLAVGAVGPFEAMLIFHPPVTVNAVGGRKALCRYCEQSIRASLIEALTGRRPVMVSKAAETR